MTFSWVKRSRQSRWRGVITGPLLSGWSNLTEGTLLRKEAEDTKRYARFTTKPEAVHPSQDGKNHYPGRRRGGQFWQVRRFIKFVKKEGEKKKNKRRGREETKKKNETFVEKSWSKMGTDETLKHLSFAMISWNLSPNSTRCRTNSLSFDIV